MKKVLVGQFNEEDLNKGIDKIKIAEAKEKTGLKFITNKFIKRGGKIVGMQVWVCDECIF